MKDSRRRIQNIIFQHLKMPGVFLLALGIFLMAFSSYAQEEDKEKDKAINLPPVKIEIIDSTQLSIPKEKFQGFAKPETDLYVTLGQKERLWYLPSTEIPDKFQERSIKAREDFLFSLSAYPGLPASLAYQMLLIKGFGKSQALLDVGRSTLLSDRSAKLLSDTSKEQGKYTSDRFSGLFTYQTDGSVLKTGLNYDAKDLGYLDLNGGKYNNSRSLVGISADWKQKLYGDAWSYLNISISQLKMDGPGSTESQDGLNLKTSFDVKALWPRANPVDFGISFDYCNNRGSEKFNETLLKLYLRDNYIRIWPFVLGAGFELAVDANKSSLDKSWNYPAYPNPYILLTSQIGSRTMLQFGAERYILKHTFSDLYLYKDYMEFIPDLGIERAWYIHASLQYILMRKLVATLRAFDREISDLTVFEKSRSKVISWVPKSMDSARISGVNPKLELSLLDDRLKQSFEYTHEFHDSKEYIPYRPEDSGCITIKYLAPYALELSLSGEFYGPRYVDANGKTLSGYFLLKPEISKSFGKNALVSLAMGFYTGKDKYQIWENYRLPDKTADFGLTIRF